MSAMRSGWLGLAFSIAALASCGDAPPAGPVVAPAPDWTAPRRGEARELEAQLAALAPGSPGPLRVHLAFGPEADLDLYELRRRERVYHFGLEGRVDPRVVQGLRREGLGGRRQHGDQNCDR